MKWWLLINQTKLYIFLLHKSVFFSSPAGLSKSSLSQRSSSSSRSGKIEKMPWTAFYTVVCALPCIGLNWSFFPTTRKKVVSVGKGQKKEEKRAPHIQLQRQGFWDKWKQTLYWKRGGMRYFDLPCSSSGGGVGPGNETRWFFPTTGEGHISDKI